MEKLEEENESREGENEETEKFYVKET